jgi:hypothetical protein
MNERILHPHERAAIASQIKNDIDELCKRIYNDGHRTHLGASQIGDECERKLWYIFRWVQRPEYEGRLGRLFNRGHREEERFVDWLRKIGFGVYDIDESLPLKDGKPQQFRVEGCGGHYGGSVDSMLVFPSTYGIPGFVAGGEYKTNGTGRAFTDLVTKGVKVAKPMHYSQMSTYGWKKGYRYSLYMNINKNDDDLHVEIAELDWALAADLERKADGIIRAEAPPRRVSENATDFRCKTCDFFKVCHEAKPYEPNCRSCQYAQPVDGAQWRCNLVSQIIPKDFIPQGCGSYHPIGR